MFEGLSNKFSEVFGSLRKKGRITEADIDATCEELRTALLDADVALSVVDNFVARIKIRSLEALPELRQSTQQSQEIYSIINQELVSILGGVDELLLAGGAEEVVGGGVDAAALLLAAADAELLAAELAVS